MREGNRAEGGGVGIKIGVWGSRERRGIGREIGGLGLGCGSKGRGMAAGGEREVE